MEPTVTAAPEREWQGPSAPPPFKEKSWATEDGPHGGSESSSMDPALQRSTRAGPGDVL